MFRVGRGVDGKVNDKLDTCARNLGRPLKDTKVRFLIVHRYLSSVP